MKLVGRDIKDKRITRAGLAYVAEVYLYNGGMINAGRHLTMESAQRELRKYPPDVFEGNDDPAKTKGLDKKRRWLTDLMPYQRPKRKPPEFTRLYDRRPR